MSSSILSELGAELDISLEQSKLHLIPVASRDHVINNN